MTEEAPPYDAGVVSAAAYKARQTEAQFMAAVRETAHQLGWVTVHFPNSLANPSGWPDLLMFRDGRVLVAELKTGTGKLGPKQWEWIGTLAGVGIHVHVWRPDMWDDQILPTLKGERHGA